MFDMMKLDCREWVLVVCGLDVLDAAEGAESDLFAVDGRSVGPFGLDGIVGWEAAKFDVDVEDC